MMSLRQKILKISLILLIAGMTSTAVFWLLRIPSSHLLAMLQFTVIIAFTTTLLGLSAKLSIHISMPHRIICTLFVTTSTLLLMSVVLQWHSIITAGFSLLMSSFLPGYVIVRLTRIEPSKSSIETLVLSYALSLPITASIGTIIFLYVGGGFRELALALIYLLMSLFLLTPKLYAFKGRAGEKIFEITNALFLLIIGVFFFVFIAGFYPSMGYVPGHDIARHFGSIQQITRAPQLLSSQYPWFNFYEAVFFALSKPSLEIFQTGLALSSFIMILTFYTMASAYLRRFDQRLPIIATAFWSIFGGFGWLWFLGKTLQTNAPFFDLLILANDVSYLDISNPRVWFWFVPMIPGFITLFTLLYLLKRHDIPTTHFRLIYSILVASLALFHIPELVILVVVLSVLSFFAPRVDLRLKDAVVSNVIGLSAVALISFSLYYNTSLIASISYNVLMGLILPLALSYLALKSNWKGIDVFNESGKFIIYVIMVVYIAGAMSWLADPSFSMWMVRETLFVPWLLYPVQLGLVGLLGLIGLLIMRRRSNNGVILFAFMFFSTLVFARLLSYVNIYLFDTGFIEQRFIQASLLPATSILAAFAMKPIMTKFPSFRHLNVRRVVLITLTSSLIVMVGTTSTFLAYDYHIEASRRGVIGDEELSSMYFLSNALYDNPRSPVLTFTHRSMSEVEFSGPIFVVNPLHLPAWSSLNPEAPLLVLFRGDPEFTAPYIYLHERDKDTITKLFPQGVLLEDIMPLLPPIHQNEKVGLYKMPDGSPPLMNSSTVLLVPFDHQEAMQAVLPVFLSLSLGGYEYTTMLDSDIAALKKNVIIIPTDATRVIVDQLLKGLKSGPNKKLIVFNSMGYGPIGKDLFSGEAIVEVSVDNDDFFFLHDEEYSRRVVDEPLGNSTEFVLVNVVHENSFEVIGDDDQSELWISQGLGKGSISAPMLSNDDLVKQSGTNSLRIQVTEGEYLQWQISRIFDAAQNWSEHDFITFYWYGYGDGKSYIVELLAPDSNNYFWYMFIDSWQGWRKVVIPLRMPETYPDPYPSLHKPIRIGGVEIAKSIKGTPSFEEVTRVNIRLSASNLNVQGTWYLDKIGLDLGRWAEANMTIVGASPTGELKLYTSNATTHTLITSITDGTLYVPASSFCFLDGSRGDTLFGQNEEFKVFLQRAENEQQLKVLVKVPPMAPGEISQLGLRIEFPMKRVKVNLIEGVEKLALPFDVKLVPIKAKEGVEVLGWFSSGAEKIPFVARRAVEGVEVTYINIYPLILYISTQSKDGMPILLEALLNTVELGLKKFSSADFKLQDLLFFKDATFEGTITIRASSITFPLTESIPLRLEEASEIRYIRSISLSGIHNVTIRTNYGQIGQGIGFYTQLTLSNSTFELNGKEIELEAEQENGEMIRLSGLSTLKFKTEGSTSVYARTPTLSIAGNTTFYEAYGLHQVQKKFRVSGHTLQLSGDLSFAILASDMYTIAKDLTWRGSVQRDPPILQWDELESLKDSILWFSLTANIFLLAYLISTRTRVPHKKVQRIVTK